MKTRPFCKLLLVIFITAVISFVYPNHFCKGVNKRPSVVNEKLDLNDFGIKADGPIYLSGKWEFYHNEFLPPSGYENQFHIINIQNQTDI